MSYVIKFAGSSSIHFAGITGKVGAEKLNWTKSSKQALKYKTKSEATAGRMALIRQGFVTMTKTKVVLIAR